MKARKQPGYIIFMIITITCTLAAISTMIPSPIASGICLLGYKAHCSFTPISTIICLLGAMTSCIIRSKFFTKKH